MTTELFVFFFLALGAVISALLMITRKNPMSSALFLIANFVALSGLYLTLHAQFIAIMQILVYAGAIMVLVLFVIMLLNLQDEQQHTEPRSARSLIPGLAGVVLAALLIYPLFRTIDAGPFSPSARAQDIGTVEGIGSVLYTSFLFPFEMTSLLLLAAIIGAVVLAKKRFP